MTLIHRTMPRSLHWLVAKERVDDIVPWIKSAERWSCSQIDLMKAKREHALGAFCFETFHICFDSEKDASVKRTIVDLFKSPVLTFHTFFIAIIT